MPSKLLDIWTNRKHEPVYVQENLTLVSGLALSDVKRVNKYAYGCKENPIWRRNKNRSSGSCGTLAKKQVFYIIRILKGEERERGTNAKKKKKKLKIS